MFKIGYQYRMILKIALLLDILRDKEISTRFVSMTKPPVTLRNITIRTTLYIIRLTKYDHVLTQVNTVNFALET